MFAHSTPWFPCNGFAQSHRKTGPVELCGQGGHTPGPHLMQIHLVRYSTSARYEKYSNIHFVRPIIHLVRIVALSTS